VKSTGFKRRGFLPALKTSSKSSFVIENTEDAPGSPGNVLCQILLKPVKIIDNSTLLCYIIETKQEAQTAMVFALSDSVFE
jgi:hypothetical protein